MISVSQNKDVYEIRFSYDPGIITLVKNVPGRRWNPDEKMWTIPTSRLGMLLNQFKGTPYESLLSVKSDENLNVNEKFDIHNDIPDIDISNINLYVEEGSELFPHQLDAIKYNIDRYASGLRSGFILSDEQGLGKTLETINFAMYGKEHLGFKHCLIICCVNTSKYNWQDEVKLHTRGKETAYILGTRYTKKGKLRKDTGGKEKVQDLESGFMYGNKTGYRLPYFIITNIESLRTREGKNYVLVQHLIKMMKSGKLNMICIDEVHKNASPSSKQGKLLMKMKKSVPENILWIPITGTPLVNKPTDVYTPLRLVDGHVFNSYYMWCQQFCVYGGFGGHEIIGYKNIPELKRLLQCNMLRRLKEDVLPDLPEKIHYVEYVENTPYQIDLYNKIEQELISDRSSIIKSLNPLSKFLRLRQVNGAPELVDTFLMDGKKYDKSYLKYNAKLKRLLELLDDIRDRNEKVILYSNWVEPLRMLYRFVAPRYKTVAFTGTMSEMDRNKSKKVFQEDSSCMVIMGTIAALGTTHTLTAARNVIFYDEPWTPSDKVQAEDRAHRIGTKYPLNIYTMITRDTVDERVHNILYTKNSLSKYIVDDSIDIHSHPELLEIILG